MTTARARPAGNLAYAQMVWRTGGLWEKLGVVWLFGGLVFLLSLMVFVGLLADVPFEEWERMGLVALSGAVTFLPATWAWESSATARASSSEGLQNPELAGMKAEYLDRFFGGVNHTARRWAAIYIFTYVSWLLLATLESGLLGLNFVEFALLDAAIVIGMAVAFAWRVHSFYLVAEARGYPIARVARRVERPLS